ncbi:hypothetical protein V5799_023279 [Amblyomma americanum]|uniref:Uncharacterized protein n=1 Tax=Amblyomma americanum TaxID=6943 RepID=A0AAQ4FIR4_AMBAM
MPRIVARSTPPLSVYLWVAVMTLASVVSVLSFVLVTVASAERRDVEKPRRKPGDGELHVSHHSASTSSAMFHS